MDLLNMTKLIGPKSLNFIRRLNRGNFYFSNQSFQIWWLISGIEARKTYKISAPYL